ncbi:MAG: hypothetical protein E7491_00115 [Ruminococcaceae bacterium]|nr:hypothetical protein [Oscillospiraceae bacterium]
MKKNYIILHAVVLVLFAMIISVTFIFPKIMAHYRVEQLEAALKTRVVTNVDKVVCDNTRIKTSNQNEYYMTTRAWLERAFALSEKELPALSVESTKTETYCYDRVTVNAEYPSGEKAQIEIILERLDVMTIKPNTIYVDETLRRFFFDMTEIDAAVAEMNK